MCVYAITINFSILAEKLLFLFCWFCFFFCFLADVRHLLKRLHFENIVKIMVVLFSLGMVLVSAIGIAF